MDITWIFKEMIGDIWRYWLDILLEIIWLSKEIFIGDLMDIKDMMESVGDFIGYLFGYVLDNQGDLNWITCGYYRISKDILWISCLEMCLDIVGDNNRIGKDKYGCLQDISEGYLDVISWLEICGDIRRSWDILVGYLLLEMSPKDLQNL